MPTSRFTLISSETEALNIKRLIFRSGSGSFPRWQAGAHVRVSIPDKGTRAYSLLRLPGLKPDEIALGILREEKGDGGSEFMHQLAVGDEVEISEPTNHFELHTHDLPVLLIAGGIGITPIFSMAAELSEKGRPFKLYYAGRHEGSLAFLEELSEICADNLTLHHDDNDGIIDFGKVISGFPQGTHTYFCGPAGMIDAIKTTALTCGWAEDHLHFESFSAQSSDGSDSAFDVVINSTGQTVHVAADQTIVQALEQAGLDPLYDCLRGDCGICQCDVIEGEPDHRDIILTDTEKASNKVMQICVSRSKGPKLVLDL